MKKTDSFGKKKFIQPKIISKELNINSFFDSRYVDSMPSLFNSFEVVAQSLPPSCCGSSSCGCVCVAHGSIITLKDGNLVPIESVKKGMMLEDNSLTGALVLNSYAHLRTDGIISINDGIVQSSLDHLFWVVNRKQWVKAEEIENGDSLRSFDGSPILVNTVTRMTGKYLVYNLELDRDEAVCFVGGVCTKFIPLHPSTNVEFSHNLYSFV